MRWLIDGYNLMHAAGLMKRRFGPNGLQKARRRFLNELAHALGRDDAAETTVVFDATAPTDHEPVGAYKGLSIIFAVEDDDADSRIEHLIAKHSVPKALTVVSSDHRIRQAAARRRAKPVTSDDFLDELDDRREGRLRSRRSVSRSPTPEEIARRHGPTADETAFWLREFGEQISNVEDHEPIPACSGSWSADRPNIETRRFRRSGDAKPDQPVLPGDWPADWTDAEMERIAREVEAEFQASAPSSSRLR